MSKNPLIFNITLLMIIPHIYAEESPFSSAEYYIAERHPQSVCEVDIDSDGDGDLAVANNSSSPPSFSVLFNDGNGIFTSKINYATGEQPNSIISSDVNGDNIADIAISGGNGILIFINNGDSTFQSPNGYSAGYNSQSIFAADINGDNYDDMIVANVYDDKISVFTNGGDGTYQEPENYITGDGPRSIYGSDYDGDNDVDLIVANADGYISVFLNSGSGTFASANNYYIGGSLTSVYGKDFNKDDANDIAVTDANNHQVIILINDGGTTFYTLGNYNVNAYQPLSIYSADFNGDGFYDIVTANSDPGNISLFLNNGDGTLQFVDNYTTDNYSLSIISADLDSDSDCDLIAVNRHGGADFGNISVLMNQSPHILGFAPPQNELNVDLSVDMLISFDKEMDLSSINESSLIVYSLSAGLHSGSTLYDTLLETITYNPHEDFKPGEIVTVTLTKDIKATNGMHLVNYFSWSFNTSPLYGNATFVVETIDPNAGVGAVFIADINNDGSNDIVTAGGKILINNGTGEFEE